MPAPLRQIALVAYFALIALVVLWEGWLAPSAYAPAALWLGFKLVPLLLLLPGLWRDRARTYLLASLVMLLYFTEGVVLAWAQRADALSPSSVRTLAWLEIVLSLALFFGAALHARRRFRETSQGTSESSP